MVAKWIIMHTQHTRRFTDVFEEQIPSRFCYGG